MDLLNILINPTNFKTTCFLCFKQNTETLSVYQNLLICNEYQTIDTTLCSIMKYLFPTHDILLSQACTDCSSFLLKAYSLICTHNIRRDFLINMTTGIGKEVESVHINVSTNNKLYIPINLPVLNLKTKECVVEGEDCNENDYDNNVKIETKYEEANEIVFKYENCNLCDMKFTSEPLLYEHMEITHKNLNNSAVCEFCGKDCKKPATLKAHLNCHKEKSCPYCLKVLKTHSHYKIHVKSHEVNTKRLSRKSEYFCSMCSFKSLNKNSLEAHINKIHLQIRPFVCKICDKGFYKKSNLTEHLSIHSKVKNLTCEQCGESFVTNKTLTEHLRLHSGEKPFQCEICNMSFVTAGRRSDHFKRKHMEKMVCCFLCDKKFSLKKQLNGHLKKVHGQTKYSDSTTFIETNSLFGQSVLDKKPFVNL